MKNFCALIEPHGVLFFDWSLGRDVTLPRFRGKCHEFWLFATRHVFGRCATFFKEKIKFIGNDNLKKIFIMSYGLKWMFIISAYKQDFSTKKFACGAGFYIDSRISTKFSEHFQLKNKHFSNNFSPAALIFALTQRFQQNFRRKSEISELFQVKIGVF